MNTSLRAGLVCSLALALHARAQVGTELQQLEKDAVKAAPVAPKGEPAKVPEIAPPAPSPVPARPAAVAAGSVAHTALSRVGDVTLLAESAAHSELVAKHAAAPLNVDDLDQYAQRIQADLIKAGYFLARVTVEETAAGSARLAVDGGRVGQVSLFTTKQPYKDLNPAQRKEQRQPYRGYFSEQQIRDRLAVAKAGEIFNYNDLHAGLVDANSNPDLSINTDLLLRTEPAAKPDELAKRYMDLNLYVQDSLPVHGAVEYKNTGSGGTEPERLIFTLQHLNLTKNDDALTLNAPLSAPDLGVLNALSASYILPFSAGKGGGISILAGWSELQANEVINDVNLDADGWFAGGRVFTRLVNTPDHLLNIAAGLVYRSIDEQVDYSALDILEDGNVAVLPLTLSLIYANNRPDALRGRNYLTFLSTYNLGDATGATTDEDVQSQSPGATTDYWVQRVEASRIQSFGGTYVPRAGTHDGEWYLFMSAEYQHSPDPLLSVEQMVMGGLETVRGYPEREIIGDRGYGGKLELRSPVFRGPVTKWFIDRRDIEEIRKQPVDYLQLVAFADAARVERLRTPEEPGSETDLLGVGAGLRLSLTSYTQAKFDYGWPLEETEFSDDGGRFHFSVQGQF